MAVITGLIGFGLFGGLVSNFLRADLSNKQPLDAFAIVWRGVSAAIVVFLAAYGGIAVVSQGGGDPNPYVVFVTCMVGAVFGDEVWKAAKAKLVQGVSSIGTNTASSQGVPTGQASTEKIVG